MSPPTLTERDWLDSADPILLLDHLFPMHGYHSIPQQPRKLRLYYAACARRASGRHSAIHVALLEAAERLADGKLAEPALAEIRLVAEDLAHARGGEGELIGRLAQSLNCDPASWVGRRCQRRDLDGEIDWLLHQPLMDEVPSPGRVKRPLHSADIVRDMFPNPFRAPAWKDEWRTPEAMGIAAGMYGARQFRSMGQLADALEEAGCEDPATLLHCREEHAAHYRGCWVVDLVLGSPPGGVTSACSG